MQLASIEITVLISMLSVASAVFFGLKNGKRADTKEIEGRAKDMAGLNMKLDFISRQTKEIKEQISSLVKEVQNHSVKIAELEQSIKSAHHRINILEQKFFEKDGKENE